MSGASTASSPPRGKEGRGKRARTSENAAPCVSLVFSCWPEHQYNQWIRVLDLILPVGIMSDNNNDEDTNTSVAIKNRPKSRKPAMYKVLMLNDDYTPMEFVVHVLEHIFNKTHEEATRIMLNVHQRGVGVCGVFTYEVAETKVQQVMAMARQNQHPLQCTIEKE
ncbi:MAG: ATP-dependent Clp protease adaptor protein ClpS [Rhodospirillaceae bacterium]|nr:MAG: ATP-dependent Clp protease adaptor protein ClpS [Rhodospirillaceae bacterium]